MNDYRTMRHILAILLLASVLLAGCPGPTVTPAPQTPTPDGWLKHETADLVIWLPKSWEVLKLGQADLNAVFAEFQKTNPQLARLIGSADALQGVSLWAFNRPATADATTVDNLNIRRAPLAGQPTASLQQVVEQVLLQYRQLGFTVGETRTDLQIGGQPAARIAFSFPMTGPDGRPTVAENRQYLIVTGTDLWVLSYAASPGQIGVLASVFEQSAQSFRAK